jgi:hypothetical protein
MKVPKPKLIVEWEGETPTSGVCTVCRATFPTLNEKDNDANKQLLEGFLQERVKAEHSDRPCQGKLVTGKATTTTSRKQMNVGTVRLSGIKLLLAC